MKRARMSLWRVVFVLMCAGISLASGLFALFPIDRDEPRYAQASKQMFETGDWVDIRFQDEPRYKKPIGVYWLQNAVLLLSENIGFPEAYVEIGIYRIPSFLAGLGVVVLTFVLGVSLFGEAVGGLASAFLLSMAIFSLEARLATTDMLLTLAIVLTLLPIGRRYAHPFSSVGWGDFLLFWGGLAFGVLIKGPIILLIVSLCLLTLGFKERSFSFLRGFRFWPGLVLFFLLTAPWFIAIALRSGRAFFTHSLGTDMGQKVLKGMESHGAPPGMYLFLAPFILGSCWTFLMLCYDKIWAARYERRIIFLCAWVMPTWLVFELIPTKLPHYVLPLTPPLAVLAAWAVHQGAETLSWGGFKKGVLILMLGMIPLGFVGAICAGTILSGGALSILGSLSLVLVLVLNSFAFYYAWKKEILKSSWLSLCASVFLFFIFFGEIFPNWPALNVSQKVTDYAEILVEKEPVFQTCFFTRRVVVGYSEPSLVFLMGQDVVLTTAQNAVDLMSQSPCILAIVEGRKLEDFYNALANRNILKNVKSESIYGLNIGNGEFVTLYFFT